MTLSTSHPAPGDERVLRRLAGEVVARAAAVVGLAALLTEGAVACLAAYALAVLRPAHLLARSVARPLVAAG